MRKNDSRVAQGGFYWLFVFRAGIGGIGPRSVVDSQLVSHKVRLPILFPKQQRPQQIQAHNDKFDV